MGSCVPCSIDALSEFNFLRDDAPKSRLKIELISALKAYKEIMFLLLICIAVLVGVYVFFQVQLKVVHQKYDYLSSTEGDFLNNPVESIQAEAQQNIDKLGSYKNIRTKSEMVFILLRVSSHLPKGALLSQLDVKYSQDDFNATRVTIDMKGNVFTGDPNQQIAVVNKIFSDIKTDKELARFIKTVNLVSLNIAGVNGQQSTGFNIHCS
jgi:hypothetical protein